MRGTLGKADKIYFPPEIWMWIVDLSIPYQKQYCRIYYRKVCFIYHITYMFTLQYSPTIYQIQGSLKSYTILPQSCTILTNIKQILPYQTQKVVEEDCGTFCGQPETVIVQRSNALNYLRPKIFNWETFVLIFLIMHSTHLRWEDRERAKARNRGES